MLEIERKFLIDTLLLPPLRTGVELRQGYLVSDNRKTVRLRMSSEKAWLTIKGKTTGITRPEFEYEIPLLEARDMWSMCGDQTLEKIRYKVTLGNHTWEIDEFLGRHKGLWLAEIELSSESENFQSPSWLGKEVSQDYRYSNSHLALKGAPI